MSAQRAAFGADPQLAAALRQARHGVDRVLDEGDEHLLNLYAHPLHPQLRIEESPHVDVLMRALRFEQQQHRPNRRCQIKLVAPFVATTQQRARLRDQLAGALRITSRVARRRRRFREVEGS